MQRDRSIQLNSLPERKADFIEPMECLPVTKLADGLEWSYEIKLDGYRAIAVKSGRLNLYSRRKKSFNSQYPAEAQKNGRWGRGPQNGPQLGRKTLPQYPINALFRGFSTRCKPLKPQGAGLAYRFISPLL